jgi:putative ABC transport system substrate-binding protein
VLFAASESDTEVAPAAVFREALARLGWVEGRNLRIDLRFGGGDPERVSALAGELILVSPDAIFAGGVIAARALQQQTKTIPIVFVGAGAVTSNSPVRNIVHPEGNFTGFANKDEGVEGKWLQLLKEAAPSVGRIAFIFSDTQTPANVARERETVLAAARSLNVEVHSVPFHSVAELEQAIDAFAREPNGGLIINSNVLTARDTILRATAEHRLPLISSLKSCTASGGLMSYGADWATLNQEAAGYVDRILRGAKPGDLPVQLPTKYELVINLRTAKALGLTISPTLLATAAQIIE